MTPRPARGSGAGRRANAGPWFLLALLVAAVAAASHTVMPLDREALRIAVLTMVEHDDYDHDQDEGPVPALASALSYVDQLSQRRGTANLLQGLRDLFGQHGFERTDRDGNGFHGPWVGSA